MSALADALVAAQRQAIRSMEKAFMAEKISYDAFGEELDAIGCTDEVDKERLLAALSVIRALGASMPAEPTNGPPEAAEELMTAAQQTFITDLCERKGVKPSDRPDTAGLTKAKASELINELKAGTYDPAAWSIPF